MKRSRENAQLGKVRSDSIKYLADFYKYEMIPPIKFKQRLNAGFKTFNYPLRINNSNHAEFLKNHPETRMLLF